jgi:hypothetical protein
MNRSGARREAEGEPARRPHRRSGLRSTGAALALIAIVAFFVSTLAPAAGSAAVSSRAGGSERVQAPGGEGSSLEAAAAKAGATGRAVAMSLIGLAFAVAATVLAFRRDFKEAAGVFAVGIVSVLLATPTGISLLRDTVGSLFGGQ